MSNDHTHDPPHAYRGEVPLHDQYGPEARYAVEAEALMPTTKWDEEVARGLELGLPGADSIVDRRIPTFSRGELPHFAGINTFLKAPYVEDVRTVGEYDVAILGAPFDGGTTWCSPISTADFSPWRLPADGSAPSRHPPEQPWPACTGWSRPRRVSPPRSPGSPRNGWCCSCRIPAPSAWRA